MNLGSSETTMVATDPVKPGMPYAGATMAKYLTAQIYALSGQKTQREIAQEIGYDKPNMISMFKRGETKVPFDKIPLLAKALHVDPAHLFRLAMEQQWPRLKNTVDAIFKNVASDNEAEIFLKKWRERTQDRDPSPTGEINDAVDVMLDALFGKLPLKTAPSSKAVKHPDDEGLGFDQLLLAHHFRGEDE